MYRLDFECVESNWMKFNRLIDYYSSCDRLRLKLPDLKRRFTQAKGRICLSTLHKNHLFEAYWEDIGGEAG